MEPGDTLEFNPRALSPGARVGAWRVQGWRGQGTYGTVYRAVPHEHPEAAPVALKLATHPRDERFAREAELLSRLRHSNVPRLLDHGHWLHPLGHLHPFLVMEWVDGVPLYEWASQRNATSRQVLAVLSQVARALEATHASGAVHRDVKGDNILIRGADDHAFLTDFGAGHYVGAETLTGPGLPPGTPPYRSPEACTFARLHAGHPTAHYAAQPADDVFALGVSAYRLVTGEYPQGSPKPPGDSNPRVAPRLGVLILRMLSVQPEARGTARELAEALEQAASQAGPEADQPLPPGVQHPRRVWTSEELVAAPVWGQPPTHRFAGAHLQARTWKRRLGAVAVGLPLALGAGWALHEWTDERFSRTSEAEDTLARRDDTTAVGDTMLTAPASSPPTASGKEVIGLDMPQKPLPGQRRPDASGKCPGKGRVALNGGCWIQVSMSREDCGEDDYVYKGGCYVPVFTPGRTPTSSPVPREP